MVWKVRRVVHHVGTIEAIVTIDLHRPLHIHLALIYKHFCKARQLPAHVAKMHPGNLIGRCHLSDGVINALWPEELCHTTLAKKHRVTVARSNFKKRAAKLSQRRADLRHTAQRLGYRRIVRVQRHANAGFFCSWDNRAQKRFHTLPHLLFGDERFVRRRTICVKRFVVEGAVLHAAASHI